MILAPLSTEKAIRLMESENKLVFLCEKQDTKTSIKADLEKQFGVKIVSVNTLIGPDAKKKAYVTLAENSPAIDLATKLELM